jgi:formylglycine-generating enzyme
MSSCTQRSAKGNELSIIDGCLPERAANDSSYTAVIRDGMSWIPGGTFTMGANDAAAYPQEGPAHSVKVKSFWIDITEVTNEQFKAFVEATKYKTVAERKPEWEELKKQLPPGTPKPPDEKLVPGSLVFFAPKSVTGLEQIDQWWRWVEGANWLHPEGPGSSIENRMNHPVVHIAYEDAEAYCKWAGKRLPTEAEWEFAARAAMEGKEYGWGHELMPQGRYMANIFQGEFPVQNTGADGFAGTAPVKSFPENNYGLYDMIGNVWELTSDWYDATGHGPAGNETLTNPKGAAGTYIPGNPYAIEHVLKGGSFLCAQNYCRNYRPSARVGTAFDSGASNIGFRCVQDD